MLAHPIYWKEPWSAATHFAGFLAAVVGVCWLVGWSLDDPVKATGMALYGVGLAGVFAASSCYHFFDAGPRGNKILRRLDHAAIFVMIAGSYVPPLLHLLDGTWRVAMLLTMGVLCALGVALKVFWFDAPTWLGMAAYLAMGWVVVIPGPLIFPQLTGSQTGLLMAGGIVYTLGALVYATQRPDPWPGVFGHHEVWHLFVLGGAALHFAFMVSLLGQTVPA